MYKKLKSPGLISNSLQGPRGGFWFLSECACCQANACSKILNLSLLKWIEMHGKRSLNTDVNFSLYRLETVFYSFEILEPMLEASKRANENTAECFETSSCLT